MSSKTRIKYEIYVNPEKENLFFNSALNIKKLLSDKKDIPFEIMAAFLSSIQQKQPIKYNLGMIIEKIYSRLENTEYDFKLKKHIYVQTDVNSKTPKKVEYQVTLITLLNEVERDILLNVIPTVLNFSNSENRHIIKDRMITSVFESIKNYLFHYDIKESELSIYKQYIITGYICAYFDILDTVEIYKKYKKTESKYHPYLFRQVDNVLKYK